MEPKLYLTYSELFDRYPTTEELVESLRGIPIRHAIYALSSANLRLRVAMQDTTQSFGDLQQSMLAAYLDKECVERLVQRFSTTRCNDRPAILPECLLNVMRIVISHGDPDPLPIIEDDERIRHLLGRACLMVNNLLVSAQQARDLRAGTETDQRIELMTQMLPGFELANPSTANHLIPRLEIMYRRLLRSPEIRARIARITSGFDLESEFETKVGISLEHWLFIVFAIYAFFLNIGSAMNPNPNHMMINPTVFHGGSGVTEQQLQTVLSFTCTRPTSLREKLASNKSADPRYDFVDFRSAPLIELEGTKVVPTDITFMLDKCHNGVQWALHDALCSRDRDRLFTAWGILFEEYVHWLLKGMKSNLLLSYFPSPKWKNSSNESFDGILFEGPVMMPAEYKGGFLARSARYSGCSSVLLTDLEKKFVVGCKQLAEKLGAVFADDDRNRKELEGIDCSHTRTVVPLLVFQDHILRGPGVNWYLNMRFQQFLGQQKMRPGVIVRPLTVISVDDLESIVNAAECEDFDFVYALHNRTVRDPEALSDVVDCLLQYPGFRSKLSPRIAEIFNKVTSEMTSFLIPEAESTKDGWPTSPTARA